jgi:hypothetical protein
MALFVVAALEGLLRLTLNRIEEPLEWYHENAQELVAEMERLEEAGVTSDVVFVGSSMVARGVATPVFEEELDSVLWAHNVGIPGAMTPVTRRWLLEEVVPRLHPRRVVWGVSSLNFNANTRRPFIESYNEARVTRRGWLGSFDRFFSDHLMLARYRAQLRDPGTIVDLLFGSPLAGEEELPLEDLLSPVNQREVETRRLHRSLIRDDALADYAIGQTQLEDFRFTVRSLQDQGIEVVVVLLPVPLNYIDFHPNGKDDFLLFLETLRAEAADLGVSLFDYSWAFPDEEFVDSVHLDASGSQTFSHMLANDLAGLGW